VKNSIHDRIEAIAGAIALGEASDEERCEYREHIASCAQCLHAFGGECEIERVAATVASARDGELWTPQASDVIAKGERRRSRALGWALSAPVVVLAASLAARALLAPGSGHVAAAVAPAPHPVTHAAAAKPVSEPLAAQPRLVVTHNVVQIARAPMPASVAASVIAPPRLGKPRDLVAITIHPATVAQTRHDAQAGVPVWRRGDTTAWQTVARTTMTSVTETAPQTLTHSAESLQIAANYTREIAPVGGETAINPQPAMIAYAEGAQGTTAFEVLVDERGTPTKCVITKSAGYPVLDVAVCKAAMKVRYTPKIVDGRAVPGVYRDAFTFHLDETSDAEGLHPLVAPPQIDRGSQGS
jgi:TonB family protein